MRLGTFIISNNIANQLPEINNLLSQAQCKVTFWGKRVITLSSYQGSYSLNELAKKIFDAGLQCYCFNTEKMSLKEQVAGREITEKLRNFYKVTDTQIKNGNWFTRLLNKMRECTSPTTRFFIEHDLIEGVFSDIAKEDTLKKWDELKKSMGHVKA